MAAILGAMTSVRIKARAPGARCHIDVVGR
jgi:hypothetical protein